ncbi:hypothetical protein [Zobellia alginiliquefaciens]|uniref:hypothetical protein n=1 Tax=Zobellia alginiliquefaciens TaxID=3032586 RepID=UPI0023E1D941|nr:hypothetical protein [Zobellia alginiliquefaciens]
MPAESDLAGILSDSAKVLEVKVSGTENNYTFSTTIQSPDTGCNLYADWWEIIDLKGNLIYRRILTHSHVEEQPFTRSGSNITLAKTTEVYIRAHVHPVGYTSEVLKGSVENGFMEVELDSEFAIELEKAEPLPAGCDF